MKYYTAIINKPTLYLKSIEIKKQIVQFFEWYDTMYANSHKNFREALSEYTRDEIIKRQATKTLIKFRMVKREM
jgi:uncharacterized protein (UPF0297 family)